LASKKRKKEKEKKRREREGENESMVPNTREEWIKTSFSGFLAFCL
jgi:hypothetical protein